MVLVGRACITRNRASRELARYNHFCHLTTPTSEPTKGQLTIILSDKPDAGHSTPKSALSGVIARTNESVHWLNSHYTQLANTGLAAFCVARIGATATLPQLS